MALTANQITGLRNRVGDTDSVAPKLTDARIILIHDDAVAVGSGNPMTRTIVMMLEELQGIASLEVSQQGDFGQQMNSDIFRRRQEMLKEYRKQLEAEVEAGVTTAGGGMGFGTSQPNTASVGVFTFPLDQDE
jgi:hypothetical protein